MMNNFPVLHTDRLDLVEIGQEHLSDIYKLFSDKKVIQYCNRYPLKNEEEGQILLNWFTKCYNENSGIRWGIALKGRRNIIGTIGYNNFTKKHRANLGYDLQQDFWNNGYMSEAMKVVVKYGFNHLEINRIEAEVMQGNIVSETLLQKLYFKKEGILRQWILWDEKYYDMLMFSLLKSDFNEYLQFYN